MTRFALPSERGMLPGSWTLTCIETPIQDLMRRFRASAAASLCAGSAVPAISTFTSIASRGPCLAISRK